MDLALTPARPTAPPEPAEPPQRLLWRHRFGAMLIEVQAGRVLVNGQPVLPAEPPPASQPPSASSTRQASS